MTTPAWSDVTKKEPFTDSFTLPAGEGSRISIVNVPSDQLWVIESITLSAHSSAQGSAFVRKHQATSGVETYYAAGTQVPGTRDVKLVTKNQYLAETDYIEAWAVGADSVDVHVSGVKGSIA